MPDFSASLLVETSPLGPLLLHGNGDAITAIQFVDGPPPAVDPARQDAVLTRAAQQLNEYFSGARTVFDLPLQLDGTEFQRRVWAALLEIPFGERWSYLQLAKHLGNAKAVRAVGLANGKNPVAVVVPCHRVVPAAGGVGQYRWGPERKKKLLERERDV